MTYIKDMLIDKIKKIKESRDRYKKTKIPDLFYLRPITANHILIRTF